MSHQNRQQPPQLNMGTEREEDESPDAPHDVPAEPVDVTHLPECEPEVHPVREPGQRGRLAGTGATKHLLQRNPPKMGEHILHAVRRARRAGMTEKETLKFMYNTGVPRQLWHDWKCHPKWGRRLILAMKLEDDPASERIEESLFERAIGSQVWREHLDSKTGVVRKLRQQLPPDVAAAELWLTNRRSERWKSRVESSASGLTVVINSPMIAQALGMTGQVVSVQPAPAVDGKTEEKT